MYHGSEAGTGDEPLATVVIRELHGLGRAEMEADSAALAEQGIDDKVAADGMEAAPVQTFAALDTLFRVDGRLVTGGEIMSLQNLGVQEQMQVRSVHIRIA